MHTRARLRKDLTTLGLVDGDIVLAHAAISRVGPILGGPDALIGAMRDAVGDQGTVMAYADWDANYEDLIDADGHVLADWRPHIPPFDPATSRANRDNGTLPEFVRTTPGARRSINPGASMTAIGAHAEWLTDDHPMDYGYGPGSPLGKLVEAGGKTILIGAPRNRMTLLHHAEHLADISGKHIIRPEVPLAGDHGTAWMVIEEFETDSAVVDGLPNDYFIRIVTEYLATGAGREGLIGDAPSVLVDAPAMVDFAVAWLERHAPRAAS